MEFSGFSLNSSIVTDPVMADTSTPCGFPPESPDCLMSPDFSDDIATPDTSTPPCEQLELNEDFVTIPDLFTSIMSADARVNPNYDWVKKESDAWISR